MRLAELPSLPKKAGKAILDWNSDKEGITPHRDKRHIILPRTQTVEFFWVVEAVQFLLITHHEQTTGGNYRWNQRCWFGGTDEEPFLVQLNEQVLPPFLESGWKGLYAALQPAYVGKADHANQPWIRQGDIFAVQLPMNWEILLRTLLAQESTISIQSVTDTSLGGTRHHIQNGLAIAVPESARKALGAAGTIAEGELVAPDHRPHTLKGPHLLLQTRFLTDPKNAD
ncbi:hypothetical protein HY523_02775 [Candidatus Berkelbacteria bacterium]|nr:hypothetical protein [Candidatus Berkelbacteria bacterium]